MNYLFYDLETTGTDQYFDQIVQFAAVKTDSEFNQVDDPINILCQPRRDVIPSPGAFRTTCIDIEDLQKNGITEFEVSHKVNELFVGEGHQCIVGYNSKFFDDRRIQTLFYRNILDPYKWSWEYGNSKLDIYDLVKLAYAFSERVPDISWPEVEGKLSLKLENLSEANDLAHDDAHDALSDVYATINIAKFIKSRNPKLLDYLLGQRDKHNARNLIRPSQTFFHCSSFYGADNKFLSCQELIGNHPTNKNVLICWNLSIDPIVTLTSSPEDVRENMYSKKDDRSFDVGFTEIKINQSPLIVPFSSSVEITQDRDTIERHSKIIKTNKEKLRSIVSEVYRREMPIGDVDTNLYAGDYFGDRDRDDKSISKFMKDPTNAKVGWKTERFNELFTRLRWRNFPDKLDDIEKAQYREYLQKKYHGKESGLGMNYDEYKSELGEILGEGGLSDKQNRILRNLDEYVEGLMMECMLE